MTKWEKSAVYKIKRRMKETEPQPQKEWERERDRKRERDSHKKEWEPIIVVIGRRRPDNPFAIIVKVNCHLRIQFYGI